jgi:hypothetical protein
MTLGVGNTATLQQLVDRAAEVEYPPYIDLYG